jgi:rhodanese-related sulfurtransferase
MVNPAQLNEDMLFNENLFILDIRNRLDRRLLKALPGSHEASFLSLGRYLGEIPRRRSILVVCQGGTDGPIAAYYLRSKGYRYVSFVMGGIVGWKLCQPELYKRLGDTGTKALKPGRKAA